MPLGLSRPVVNCPSASPVAVAEKATLKTELTTLVLRAQAGDLAAQSALVRGYSRRISGFVRRIAPVRSAVEDIVQTVFIKMVRRVGLLRDPQTFESWLFALARNTALDFIRRRRCQPTTFADELEEMAAPDAHRSHTVEEITAALDQALVRLSPKDRQLVRLIVEGNSYRVIAEREGLSVGAIKIRMHRVRPYLRLRVSQAIGVSLPSAKKWQPPPPRGCLAA
jgi:RNA polymerase sigma-70 factor, ECF subfamily